MYNQWIKYSSHIKWNNHNRGGIVFPQWYLYSLLLLLMMQIWSTLQCTAIVKQATIVRTKKWWKKWMKKHELGRGPLTPVQNIGWCNLLFSFKTAWRFVSVCLSIPDPIKTAQGSLSLKAYRLTPKLMEICKEKDFTPEGWVDLDQQRHTCWVGV